MVIAHRWFLPDGPDQCAVDLSWPEVESCVNTTVIFRGCLFSPGHGYWWGEDIVRLTNGWNAQFDGCNFVGPSGLPEPLTLHGIVTAGGSTAVTVRNCTFSGFGAAWFAKGDGEGQRFLNNDVVGCRHGFVGLPDSGGHEPGVWILGNHFNTTINAVLLKQRYHVFCRDNLCYAGDYYTSSRLSDYVAFDLDEDCYEVDCGTSNKVGRAHGGVEKKVQVLRHPPAHGVSPVLLVEPGTATRRR